MTALELVVTGVDGFVGRHVARLARARGHHVIGVTRSTPIDVVDVVDELVVADLTERWPTDVLGDAIIHLAGLAAVGPSFDHPQQYIETNSRIVTNLGEYLQRARSSCRVIGISTGAVYRGTSDTRLTEDSPTATSSPYVVSKLLVEAQLQYYGGRGLDVVIARPFNHIGPGQSSGFIVPDLVSGLRALTLGQPLRTGNLATRRDYTDVRDVAEAYLLLAEAEQLPHRLYNVASGTSLSGRDILEGAAQALGIDVPQTETDPARLRSGDADRIEGDAARLREDTGWKPTIDATRSIADFVEASDRRS